MVYIYGQALAVRLFVHGVPGTHVVVCIYGQALVL